MLAGSAGFVSAVRDRTCGGGQALAVEARERFVGLNPAPVYVVVVPVLRDHNNEKCNDVKY